MIEKLAWSGIVNLAQETTLQQVIVRDPDTQNVRWHDTACYTFYFTFFY